MASVYTERLGVFEANAAANVLVYTVPAGVRVILRDLTAYTNGASGTLSVYVVSGSGAYTFWYVAPTELGSHHLELRQALDVGDQLFAATSGTSSWQVAVTGYVFKLG